MRKNIIEVGDLVRLIGDREVRKVLDIRIYRREDGYREKVFRLEGLCFWVPEERLERVKQKE